MRREAATTTYSLIRVRATEIDWGANRDASSMSVPSLAFSTTVSPACGAGNDRSHARRRLFRIEDFEGPSAPVRALGVQRHSRLAS